MSFLIRQKVGEDEQLFFGGSRLIDEIINVINGTHDFINYQYVAKGSVDKQNVELLKYKLGSIRMEKNNTDGTKNIKNDQQKKLYDDFVRMNTFLASMFLYLYHCFYYESFPITTLKGNGQNMEVTIFLLHKQQMKSNQFILIQIIQ